MPLFAFWTEQARSLLNMNWTRFLRKTVVEFGRIYSRNGQWKFEAVGTGMKGGLEDDLNRYSYRYYDDDCLFIYYWIPPARRMSGEPIEAVKNGVQVLISTLRQDPYALETACLSVITFDSSVRQLYPSDRLGFFFRMKDNSRQVEAPAWGGLRVLSQCMDSEIEKSTAEKKGDWKPLIFLMTDGSPTDDWQSGWRSSRNDESGHGGLRGGFGR